MSDIRVSSQHSDQSSSNYSHSKEATINIQDGEDICKWAKNLGLTTSQLIDAIRKFGPVVKDIRKGLLKENPKAA